MKELWLEGRRPPFVEAIKAYSGSVAKRATFDSPYQDKETLEEAEVALTALFDLVSADKKRDLFVVTSGVEEACSQIVATHLLNPKKNHLIALETDMAPIYLALLEAQEKHKAELSFLKPEKDGTLSPDELQEAITDKTALICLSAISPLIGTQHNLDEIAQIAHKRGVLVHVDVGAGASTAPYCLATTRADFLTFDGQDIGSIPGSGALFVANHAPLEPLIWGHKCHERYRGGPLNVPALVALGAAAKKTKVDLVQTSLEVARLKNLFESELQKRLPQVMIVCGKEKRIASLSTVIFPKIKNELLLFALAQRKLFASIGGGRYQNIDTILEATGIERHLAMCTISFCFSLPFGDGDVQDAVERIVQTYTALKELQ